MVSNDQHKQPADSRPASTAVYRLLWSYLKVQRRWIVLGVLVLILVDFLQLLIPRVIKTVIDALTDSTADPSFLLSEAAKILALSLVIGLLRYVWRRCLIGTSRKVEEGLRNQLYTHLLSLSADYFSRTTSGDLMAHATNDIQHIRMATGMGMVALTDAVVLGSAAIGFMAYISWTLTLLVLIPMPMIVFGTRLFSRQMHRRYRASQSAFADLTEGVRDRLTGIRIIKAHGEEAAAAGRTAALSERYVSRNLSLARIVGSFFPMMVLFSNLSLAMVLFFGGRLTIFGDISPGDFVAFISYLGLLTWPMMAMGWVTNLIQRGRASLERINTILETRPTVTDTPTARSISRFERVLEIDALRFSYPADPSRLPSPPVIDGIDLTLTCGTTLGIVGPPGSGKTTLLSLLPRIFDPDSGSIRIDGHDIRDLRRNDLRRLMAVVPQEPFLFAGTIGDNIRFGNPGATEAQVMAAVEKASLTETLSRWPEGLDTLVGERGVVLSGGQKQRVALARAFLKDASLWILDDPISQVDMETGEAITQAIRSSAARRTVVIVSHRLSALAFADRIVTFEAGRVTESGCHADLMAAEGYYAKAFHLQELEMNLV